MKKSLLMVRVTSLSLTRRRQVFNKLKLWEEVAAAAIQGVGFLSEHIQH